MAKKTKSAGLRWYVCRDSGSRTTNVYPECVGLKKYHGCCFYISGRCNNVNGQGGNLSPGQSGLCMQLTTRECKEVFGDFPQKGEAWLVHEEGKYIIWEYMDIPFSDFDNDND